MASVGKPVHKIQAILDRQKWEGHGPGISMLRQRNWE